MSIATEIGRIAQAKADIKRAINAKGGVLVNEKLSAYAAAIDDLLPEEYGNRVRFIDYDGTVLKTQYIADGESATPPANPSHGGLRFLGWNNDYTDIHGYRDIGAMYTTTSGKTEFDIRVTVPTGSTVTFYPYLVSGQLTIAWGDGTTDTVTTAGRRSISYTYAEYGDYKVTFSISLGGEWYIPEYFCGDSSRYWIYNARLAGVPRLGNSAFQYCPSLQTITMDTAMLTVGEQAFRYCRALQAVVFPNTVTEIQRRCMQECYALSQIVFPDSITAIKEETCYACHSLDSVVIPTGITQIGDSAFYGCNALRSVFLPDTLLTLAYGLFRYCRALAKVHLPQSLTSIGGNAFYECCSLERVTIPNGASCGESAFARCYNLRSINIPTGWTAVPYGLCSECFALESISIPENITTVRGSAFYECHKLRTVEFRSTLTNIESDAFGNNHSMRNIHCRRQTPPTMGSTDVFYNLPRNCKIWVPASTDREVLTAYKTASNWSAYADFMYEE